MSEHGKPQADITKAWQASQAQTSQARRLRIFAVVSWALALGAEGVGIFFLFQNKFDEGNLPLLLGLLALMAIGAMGGSFLWKAANKHNPAKREEKVRFFIQNQLGALVTLLAFVPLLVLMFLDKDMDPKNKKIAGGAGVALAVAATLFGVSYAPPSVEQYTMDMNTCATQIKQGLPTTACSPEVAEQAQEIARDSEIVANATKSAANPDGLDVVYWITPPEGEERHDSPRVFHLCPEVSVLKNKPISQGTVTDAYADNAIRLTKQLKMEQRQCGVASALNAHN